jgi:DNA-binding PadR family transcriptional regulator
MFYIQNISRRKKTMDLKLLSKAEELVLMSVWHLKDEAYGVAIRRHVIKATGENWSIGAIYVPLDRLTKWGYLDTILSDPTPERGGRSKRYYRMTKLGWEALQHTRRVKDEMWSALPDMEFEKEG